MQLSNKTDWRRFQNELATLDHPTGLNPFEIRFCLVYGSGQYRLATQAYRAVLPLSESDLMTDADVTRNTNRLLLRPVVRKYLNNIIKKVEEVGIADIVEVQMFLTNAIRTPINVVDGDSPLCQKKTVRTNTSKDGAVTETVTYESVSKMDAVKTLSRMKGWDAPLKIDMNHSGGVMMVPMASDEQWEQQAKDGQKALMKDAIDV